MLFVRVSWTHVKRIVYPNKNRMLSLPSKSLLGKFFDFLIRIQIRINIVGIRILLCLDDLIDHVKQDSYVGCKC